MNAIMSIRLDAETRRRLEEFRVSSGFDTPTQAIRAAIMLGLSNGEAMEPALRRAVVSETTKAVTARVLERLQTLLVELEAGE